MSKLSKRDSASSKGASEMGAAEVSGGRSIALSIVYLFSGNQR
jgi:hypothetical protein